MRFVVLAMLLVVVAFLLGCSNLQSMGSSIQSATIKIPREIILYSATGDTIEKWVGRYSIEDRNSGIKFFHNGKAVTLNGTYKITEL